MPGILGILLLGIPYSALGNQQSPKGTPAFPGKSCQVPGSPDWKPEERWVWTQVCEGKIADFNQLEGYGGVLDPKVPEDWPENRILRPAFLEAILLHQPYQGAIPRDGVRIRGAWFTEPIDLSNARVSHVLWLNGCRFDSNVFLKSLRISHVLSFGGSKFHAALSMDKLQAESSLLMRGAQFQDVNLVSAVVNSNLELDGSRVHGNMIMYRIQVGGALFLRRGGEFTGVNLRGARIGDQLNMSGSRFTGPVRMDSIRVGTFLLMQQGAEFVDVSLVGGKVDGSWSLHDAKFHGHLDLSGFKIDRFLDTPDAWPQTLNLDGFSYAHLDKNVAGRGVSWFVNWLRKQGNHSPQPYEKLARALKRAGYFEKADDILYEGKEWERSTASWSRWVWLTLLKMFIGYGYHPIFSLYWAMGFVVLGGVVFRQSEEAKRNHMPYGISYSLDLLLPIIQLRARHYTIDLAGWQRYYFYVHQIMGYVLVSFLIAGLSGLTK